MSGTPLGPTVPTVAPSSTVVPRITAIEPRWTRVTAYPVGVWIVTVLPPFGTVPANDTSPPAAATTGVPLGAPMSMPRCWPAAYGSLPKENGRRTGPSTGHVQADGDRTLGLRLRERPQRRWQTVRRLEGDRRVRPPRELLPPRRQRRAATREVAQELVPIPDEAARHEGRLHRRRARKDRDLHALVERRAHQPRPRIADRRQPRVAQQRDALAGAQPREHLGRPCGLVVLVVREQARPNAVTAQQDRRMARVLAEHDVRLAELAEDAQGDVLEVADRGRTDGERHAPASSSASKATSPAPTRPAAVPSSARTIRTSSRAGESVSRATSSRAGSRRKSPAAENPPPTTTSSGLKTFTRLTMPAPSRWPNSPRTSTAVWSPSFASRTSRWASTAGPKCSFAAVVAAWPEASASRWPRPVQAPWHGGPSRAMTICP